MPRCSSFGRIGGLAGCRPAAGGGLPALAPPSARPIPSLSPSLPSSSLSLSSSPPPRRSIRINGLGMAAVRPLSACVAARRPMMARVALLSSASSARAPNTRRSVTALARRPAAVANTQAEKILLLPARLLVKTRRVRLRIFHPRHRACSLINAPSNLDSFFQELMKRAISSSPY